MKSEYEAGSLSLAATVAMSTGVMIGETYDADRTASPCAGRTGSVTVNCVRPSLD